MLESRELARCLERLEGRGFKNYREIEGAWRFVDFTLYVDRVQPDPFASPSKLRIRVAREIARLPEAALTNGVRRIASASFLARRFRDAIQAVGPRRRGTGKGGLVAIDAGGQEVLERTAVVFGDDFVEARIEVGLPAAGRRILGHAAAELLIEVLPEIVRRAWIDRDAATDAVFARFVDCIENQEVVRGQLAERELVSFVGDGARLPRESGASDLPLRRESTLAFESPEVFRVEFEVPHPDAGMPGRVWRGMGLPRGVVLLVGGGYHGKSTLLRAIECAVSPHVPGDGRETVVSDPALVKIRAEDGRAVTGVDIHGFIDHLPERPGSEPPPDTRAFSTTEASGSTSQAANIVEALEAGARGLLLDEDTSATNFMLRDARMQALIHPRDEPITPFLDRVRELYDRFGVSSVLVMGASGEYFGVADAVIQLENYRPRDVTARARALVGDAPNAPRLARPAFERPRARVPLARSFDASRGQRDVKISSRGCDEIVFGRETIDLRALDQLFDPSQTRAIANALQIAATRCMASGRTLSQILDDLDAILDAEGLDALDLRRSVRSIDSSDAIESTEQRHPGAFARPRRFEITAAINRLRTLRVED